MMCPMSTIFSPGRQYTCKIIIYFIIHLALVYQFKIYKQRIYYPKKCEKKF